MTTDKPDPKRSVVEDAQSPAAKKNKRDWLSFTGRRR